MTTNPAVLILGGTAPVWATDGRDIAVRSIRQFRARGSKILLTDTAAALNANPELAAAADEVHSLDFTDPGACVAWAQSYIRNGRIDAVVGFREYAMVAVAEVASALGLRGNDPQVVRRVRSKDACREFLRKSGFAQPDLVLCSDVDQAREFFDRHAHAPIILKPRDRCNSEGVSLVTDAAALPAAFETARGEDGVVLAETFVEGAEYSVEGLFAGGVPTVLAVTAKTLSPGSFLEAGHTMPAVLPDHLRSGIERETVRALSVLGLSTGPFHVECWLTPRGVVLGEVHARQGGDGIHALLEWCHPGLELYGYWLDDLLGRTRRLPVVPRRGGAVRFLTPPAGTVARVRGWDAVAAHPAVLASAIDLDSGTEIGPQRSNGDRRGMVMVGTDQPDAAGRVADELIGMIDVEVA
ncbi:ATP-grasp domain-containing protein [Nocardia sp. NPDC050175]|uniref:ATP-grasp domain-containing protein n=1 Tax=Nocardia sp. NPDC050175 TaxID=3364317 RepID=UPI0037B75DF2